MDRVRLVFALLLAVALTSIPVTVSKAGVTPNEACGRLTCMTSYGFRCTGAPWPYDANRCKLGTPGCEPSET